MPPFVAVALPQRGVLLISPAAAAGTLHACSHWLASPPPACRVPWQTDDLTLQQHFRQYGPVDESQIMREKYSGKSRGFGFVTFRHTGELLEAAWRAARGECARLAVRAACCSDRARLKDDYSHLCRMRRAPTRRPAVDAVKAVNAEHVIDGRKCEAKFALPEGKVGSARTTRIFVARIPASVGDAQFRQYFEQVRGAGRGAANAGPRRAWTHARVQRPTPHGMRRMVQRHGQFAAH